MHNPTTTGPTTTEPSEQKRPRFLIPVMVVATSLLSAAFTYGGILVGALTGLCYKNGPSTSADACATSGYSISAAFVGTVAIPLCIGLWARRARDTPQSIARVGACLAGYLLPLTMILASASA